MHPEDCQICGQPGQGNHFGVVSCRACAVFFRRTADSKWTKMGCLSRHCDGKDYHCKPCRLKRCRDVGMDSSKFQYNRDPFITFPNPKSTSKIKIEIPKSFSILIGRPDHVLFCTPSTTTKKTFIDMKNLLETARKILETGAETPIVCGSQLEKLTMGFRNSQGFGAIYERVSRREIAGFWEFYLLRTAKWLTYFDEFQMVPMEVKMQLLLSTWHVFSRLDKLCSTAKFRNQCPLTDSDKSKSMAMSNGVVVHQEKTAVDFSWLSKYPLQQLVYFLKSISGWELQYLVDQLINLSLSEVESSWLMGQLCFEYASKRFGGEVAKYCDRFQEVLADDLHSYYLNGERRNPRYSGRLAKMLKINNEIQKNIIQNRPRADLAATFDIFSIEFSHPEMFGDTGFCSMK